MDLVLIAPANENKALEVKKKKKTLSLPSVPEHEYAKVTIIN
jgi:hypothetical protein